jgi:type VI secretion system protein ImpB
MPGYSVQQKFDRVRPPRVQIKYELEIGDTPIQQELPFVVGVMGDYSGKPDPENPLPKFKERKFVNIDRDNFDKVMAGFSPRLAFSVADKISSQPDNKLNVVLNFREMEDFTPERIVEQVEPLRKLLEARHNLAALKSKIDGNDALAGILEQVISNPALQQQLDQAK